MPDAVQIVGDYMIEGDTLKISVILVKNNQLIGKEIVSNGNVNGMEKLIKKDIGVIKNFNYIQSRHIKNRNKLRNL